MIVLDHFAIAAETLESGRAYAEEALGVSLLPGGQHPHFGTHNLLLGLEDGLYLEVISIDPDAPAPEYPRWFDLGRFAGRPRPTNWICRTDDLSGFVAEYPQAGTPVPLARGDLRWQMSVPPTGILPYDNMFPAVIEWASDDTPARRLSASGCGLKMLTISHPDADLLSQTLAPVFKETRVRFETAPAGLVAEMDTPSGVRVLE